MRITNNILITNMSNYIADNLSRMDLYQSQLATGKKIRVPSDDPVVAARALKLRTNVAEITQYKKNLKDAQSRLDITDTALSDLGDIFQRIRELNVGSDGVESPEDLNSTLQEVKQLKTQMIQLANSTYAGKYIFSGFQADKKFMKDDGTFNIGVSNTEKINFEIGIGDNISVNVTGGDLFNEGVDAAAGGTGKFIKDFEALETSLQTPDYDAIQATVNEFSKNLDTVLRVRADVGARTNRVELTINRMQNDETNFTKLMSENENVDEADTIMNLKNEENVYQASLAGGARIILPTLLDFLK